MKILYRISDHSYIKDKLANASKEACFLNFCQHVLLPTDRLIVIADRISDSLKGVIQAHLPTNGELQEINAGSNSASFRYQLDLVQAFDLDEIVYLHEDDYLYKPQKGDNTHQKLNHQLILEGLVRAEYISLYDHPDKYLPPSLGGNPVIRAEGVEMTGVFLTQHSHWKYTNSTTLTFAAKVHTLLKDMPIWLRHSASRHPEDFSAFWDVMKINRHRVATPIPGVATHAELAWLTPLFDWREL